MKFSPRLSLLSRGSCFLLALAGTAAPLGAQRMELSDASASAVTVESAEIKTEVTGRIAVTTFDLVFRNPNPRVLEGTFALPLLDGQTVVRFALDVNGALREAVPVDKVRGRVVFEEIKRQRVDPGLLEQTAGNNYRARVFPIPPGGTRRIVVAYQEDVGRGAGAAAYRLNLDFPDPLKKFRLALTAFTGGAPAKVSTTLGLDLPAWRGDRFMEIARTDFVARGVLELALPSADRPRMLTGRHRNDEFFYAEAPIALPSRPRPAPRVVGLLWDSSGSGRDRDHAREFALLDAWFATLGRVEVRLVRLRDQAEVSGTFGVRDGHWSTLRKELAQTAYDGATSLDGLTHDTAVDEWLLFSDGLINYGVTPASAKLKLRARCTPCSRARVPTPHGCEGSRAATAASLSTSSNSTPLLLSCGSAQSARVLRVASNPNEVAEVFPEADAVVAAGPMVVAGILRGDRATVQLHVGTNEIDAQTIEVAVHSGENSSRLAARGWASAKIAQLSLDPAVNRADIRRTSREFGLVTADTSLIVLETVADYARYEIEPPNELRREWAALRKTMEGDRRKNHAAHLESLVRAFNERVAWWEKSFPKDPLPSTQASSPQFSPADSPRAMNAPQSRA